MEKLIAALSKFNKGFCKVCKALAGLCVAAFTLVTFAQVIGRNFLKIPMIWSIDVCTLMFTWCVFLGCIMGVYYRSHYRIELFPERLVIANTCMDIFSDVLCGLFYYWLIKYGIAYVKIGMRGIMESMRLPKGYLYLVVPVAAAVMFWMNIQIFLEDLHKLIGLLKRPKTAE